MPVRVRETIIKLLVISFFVGISLSFFDVDPRKLLANFGETIDEVFAAVAGFIEWSVKYVLLGAVVVVPIWAVLFGVRKLAGKSRHTPKR